MGSVGHTMIAQLLLGAFLFLGFGSATASSPLIPIPTSTTAANSNPINELVRSPPRSSSSVSLQKLLRTATRRLEDNENDDADAGDDNNNGNDADYEEDMEAFLMDYSLKFMKCIPDQVLTDADYQDHMGVVIFRLCPSNTCSSNTDGGCTSGYAEFAVDVGTYVEAFIEDQADNMNWDDENFDGDEFGQCVQWDGDDNDGDDDNADDDGNAQAYYIGPGCTSDGSGVKMGVYEDQYCYEESATTFATIANGWSLPYSEGGLVSTSCTYCTDDDGDIRDMCLDLYDYAPHRCEANFEYTHYYYDTNFEMYRYGKDQTGCNNIAVLQNPRSQFSSEAVWTDAILVVMILLASVVGFYYYSQWWNKQKENLEKIEEDDEDDSEYQREEDDEFEDPNNETINTTLNDSAISGSTFPSVTEGTMA